MKVLLEISTDPSGYLIVGKDKSRMIAPWGCATGRNVVNLFDLKRTAKLIYNQ